MSVPASRSAGFLAAGGETGAPRPRAMAALVDVSIGRTDAGTTVRVRTEVSP